MLLLSCIGANATFAQENEAAQLARDSKFASDKKGSTFGFGINLWEFNESPKFENVDMGLSLMYWQGITRHLDYSIRFNGLFSNHIKALPDNADIKFVPELEASLHMKALSDDHLLNPFISAGVGAGYYNENLSDRAIVPYAPVGVGLQMNFNSDAYLFLQGNYRFSFSDVLDNHLFYSIGLVQTINTAAPKAPPAPVLPPDTDGDGVADALDKCPTVAGSAHLNGCPDTDNDGIIDLEDKCPNEAGVAKYNGCPIPDTDGDGVNDEEDECPTVAGIAKYKGCPVPDSDGDGVNDEMDKCPTVPGPASNRGCPEVKEEVKKRLSFAATAIQFETGKAVITKKSHAILDEVVDIMNEYKDYDMHIHGHTDNTGKADRNQILSEERAAAVKQYFIDKGISASRLHSKGFGQDEPVADNKTAAGRAKNRRVELDLKLQD